MSRKNNETSISSVTKEIVVAYLKKGIVPWFFPWERSGVPLQPRKIDDKTFGGAARILLWIRAAENKEFKYHYWLSFMGASNNRSKLKENEKGTPVPNEREEDNEPWKKNYFFNPSQFEVIHPRFLQNTPHPPLNPSSFLEAVGANINMGGGMVFYSERNDVIQMPGEDRFETDESFFAAVAPELIRWSEHPHRRGKNLSFLASEDQKEAFTSLTASVGAAFLCADMGLAPDMSGVSKEDVSGWIKLITANPDSFLVACERASKSVAYLFSLRRSAAPYRLHLPSRSHPRSVEADDTGAMREIESEIIHEGLDGYLSEEIIDPIDDEEGMLSATIERCQIAEDGVVLTDEKNFLRILSRGSERATNYYETLKNERKHSQ